jgi:hypothetical protein
MNTQNQPGTHIPPWREVPEERGGGGHQERRGYGRKKRFDSGDGELNIDPVQGRQRPQAMNRENGFVGENHGGGYDTFQTKTQHIKVGGIVGGIKKRFEKQSTSLNEESNGSMNGKILSGFKEGASETPIFKNKHVCLTRTDVTQITTSPIKSLQVRPAGADSVGEKGAKEDETRQAMGFDGVFSSTWGKYSGPKLADVAKSIQEANGGGPASKRKNWEANFDQNGIHSIGRRKRNSDEKKGGTESITSDEMGSTIQKNIDGSGMAEARSQPRRPQ